LCVQADKGRDRFGVPMIQTRRPILRARRKSDLPLFAEQDADPVVMGFLAGVITRDESDAVVIASCAPARDRTALNEN